MLAEDLQWILRRSSPVRYSRVDASSAPRAPIEWLPALSPTPELVSQALGADDDRAWNAFVKKFRAEMNKPDAARLLDLLAVMSHDSDFAVWCYCENEERCHRSVLRALFKERGAKFA